MDTLPTVYVVDDEEIVRHSLEVLLGTLQLRVRTFPTAHAFLKSLTEDWRGFVLVDLKLTDINGLELMTRIQTRNASLKLVLMTGHGDESALSQAMNAGAVATLEKPFAVEKLKNILRHTETGSCATQPNNTKPT